MIMLSLLASHSRKENDMIRGIKGSKIVDKTFKFDGEKIKNKLEYQGKGKAPDKRYDEKRGFRFNQKKLNEKAFLAKLL